MPNMQHIPHRPRLFFTVALGVAAGLFLPDDWPFLTRLLVAWNIGVWTYLPSVAWLLMRADHAKVKRLAEQEDNSAAVVLATLSLAALFSLVAIVLLLGGARESAEAGEGTLAFHYLLTFATVVGAWLLLGVLFAIHYARMYFREPAGHCPLAFPDTKGAAFQPDYWDFLYFAFTIAAAVQTADVAIQSRDMRRVVLAQSILGFFFNAAVLGLSVNIAAGLLGH